MLCTGGEQLTAQYIPPKIVVLQEHVQVVVVDTVVR